MTWQVGLFLIVVVGWIGLHPWLGRKGHRKLLGLLILLEFGLFAALWVYLADKTAADPSVGMATGLVWFAGFFALALPAALGGFALWKHRRSNAEQIQE